MNKFAILCMAAFATCVASAASVKWTSGTFSDGFTDHNGNSLANNTAYTMSVYFYTDAGITQFGDVSTAVKGNQFTGAYGNSPTGFSNSTQESTVIYYCKAIISGTDGDDVWQRESTLADFSMPTQNDKNINFLTGAGFNTAGSKWGEWQTVPEPFSGTLALLGMIGIGLRRKLKKAKKA